MATPNIAPDLQQHTVPIDTLKPWPGNPRQGNIDGIAESLADTDTGGQYRPIVVQKSSGQICVGNNTWIAAKEKLGWDAIAATFLDIGDTEAKKLLARDNKLSDESGYNEYLLADMLSDIIGEAGTLDGTGYEPADLDDLLKTTGALAEQGTNFLTGFIPDDAPTAPAPSAPPAANPFSDAPAQPAPTAAAPAPPAAEPAAAQPAPAPAPQHGEGVHTGPDPYRGPGAPATPTGAADIPERPDLTNIQWVVTVAQRDTIRAAIKHAQANGGHDTAAEGLTAVCAAYLTDHDTEATE